MNHESICENLNIPQIYGYFVRNQIEYFPRNSMLYHNLFGINVFVLATTCSKQTSASNSLDLHPIQYLKCIFCQQLVGFTFILLRMNRSGWLESSIEVPHLHTFLRHLLFKYALFVQIFTRLGCSLGLFSNPHSL